MITSELYITLINIAVLRLRSVRCVQLLHAQAVRSYSVRGRCVPHSIPNVWVNT
jgi:hypothetical protein